MPDTSTHRFAAIDTARRRAVPRVAFHVDGRPVGSVAQTHRTALGRWPRWIVDDGDALHLAVEPASRSAVLAEINDALRADGLIVAWRDETFPLYDPASGAVLATFERAATRFWGTLTRGAHANGWVAGADGRPAALWIARRSPHKPTDPGKLDNLVGGGVPHGQTPHEALLREGWEEAGLTPAQMAQARPGRCLVIDRDVPEGRMVEQVFVFDLELPRGLTPVNQDGEVAELHCLPVAEAAQRAAGEAMTVDASLATLDFLLRHRLLPEAEHTALEGRMAPLWLAP